MAPRGTFDLVLLDLWKDLYTRPAAIAYQARVRTKPDLDSVLLPIGSGVELSRKQQVEPLDVAERRRDRQPR
jgi:predicted O-methyltransferase YrrM